MANLSNQKVSEIRNNLKKEFPSKDGWKFSVTRPHYSRLNVSIMQAPIQLENNESSEIFKRVRQICMEGNHDNNDIQSDYFDVGWYLYLRTGKWNKPFVCKEN